MKKILILILLLPSIVFSETLVIQSTTSTRDSGLYNYLLPHYPDYSKIKIKVIAVGTGLAMLNAKNCDGDILIVHDKKRELRFMADGYGIKRHELMYNDFVIVGPKNNLTKINKLSSAKSVFSHIFTNNLTFISRSDSSGTHSAEMHIWDLSSLNPIQHSGAWYLESGQGMGQSLNIAIALNGYIFSDRSSWLRFSNKKSHTIVYENPIELRNDYGMILVNHSRCKKTNSVSALKLYDWLASKEAAQLIIDYKLLNSNVFYIK